MWVAAASCSGIAYQGSSSGEFVGLGAYACGDEEAFRLSERIEGEWSCKTFEVFVSGSQIEKT